MTSKRSMGRFTSFVFASCCLIAVSACQQTSPDEYFVRVALGANLMFGFAGAGMQRELATPSEKLTDAKTGATAPMTRAEVLQFKVDAVQNSYEGVKDLKPNNETKEMIAASLALHELVLTGYREEYKQLAALYDDGPAPDKIAATV